MKIETRHIIKGVALSLIFGVISVGLTILSIALTHAEVVVQGGLLHGIVVAIPTVYAIFAIAIVWILGLFIEYISTDSLLGLIVVLMQLVVTLASWSVIFVAGFSYLENKKSK